MVVNKNAQLEAWLEYLWDHNGSDLLLIGGSPPRLRIDGKLEPLEGAPILTAPEIEAIVHPLLSPSLRETLASEFDVDFAFSWSNRARLRGNAFIQRGTLALALRIIPTRIPTYAELGLPLVAETIASLPRGLVLVTGPTGSGKSTTLAAIVDRINQTRSVHILTVEDPMEYTHKHSKAVVSQREIGLDSNSFERALRAALREDPDVLLVGEMRDIESMQIALTMAETGHLVFATLHTNDAPQAIDRIIDVFPEGRQEQIRTQMSSSLAAIIAQRLIPKIGGGMVAAFETLVANNAVRNLIRQNSSNQLQNVMLGSRDEGMCTLETSLAELVRDGIVDYDDALAASVHPKELARAMSVGIGVIRKA